MHDLQLSFSAGADGKHTVATTVVFDKADEALMFNERLVELLKATIEDHLKDASTSEVVR